MRILKLHYPTGHPFWQADEYEVELPDGKLLNLEKFKKYPGGPYRLWYDDRGIWFRECACGSGYGKIWLNDLDLAQLIVPASDYDRIEYVGEPLVMSDELKNDLRENQISF